MLSYTYSPTTVRKKRAAIALEAAEIRERRAWKKSGVIDVFPIQDLIPAGEFHPNILSVILNIV